MCRGGEPMSHPTPRHTVPRGAGACRWLCSVARPPRPSHPCGPGPQRLPTACVKALSAIQFVLPMPPVRAEYMRRIRVVAAQEESPVPARPPPASGTRTYTLTECQALLSVCESHRDRLLLLLLQRVGLRNTALRTLTLDAVTEPTPPHPPRLFGTAIERPSPCLRPGPW